MTLNTRKPTGKPPWPITLLAGAEKAGKSYAAAAASGSDLIDRTFWIGVGEDDPDEYGAIDGARFEIVQHDGTWKQIANAIHAATTEPTNGKPHLIVLDSATRLWEMLSDEAQTLANKRKKNNNPDQDSPVSMDLWNRATDRWNTIVGLLRAHQGPVLVTARLDVVTVLDDAGKPTKEKTTKIKSQKALPYDVGVVVEMPARGETFITGVRSLKFDVKLDERKALPDFTVDGLWRQLGLDVEGATSPRQHSNADGPKSVEESQVKPWDQGQADTAIKYALKQPQPVDALKTAWREAKASGADQTVLAQIQQAAQEGQAA